MVKVNIYKYYKLINIVNIEDSEFESRHRAWKILQMYLKLLTT